MEHLDFILWMILFPISLALEKYIYAKAKGRYDELRGDVALVIISIWFGVGYLLF